MGTEFLNEVITVNSVSDLKSAQFSQVRSHLLLESVGVGGEWASACRMQSMWSWAEL